MYHIGGILMRYSKGITLIELMVALAIGLIVVAAAMQLFDVDQEI